jgi:hypothetical protein
MSAEQAIQSVVIDAYVSVMASGSAYQAAQTVSISATHQNKGGTQAVQVTNAQAFIKINASVSVQQSQSLSVDAFYYDIAIVASTGQSIQNVLSSANISTTFNTVIEQPKQYMSATVVSGVFSPQSAEKVMTKNTYRILRKVRNTGRR